MADDRSVEDLRSRNPGDDPENPYEDVDIETLPKWWQRAIEEFETHDLRPYRPPRFADGALVHEVVSPLEREFRVTIEFASVDCDYRERWAVFIDGTKIETIGRHRSPAGYTVYEVDHNEFESLLRETMNERGSTDA